MSRARRTPPDGLDVRRWYGEKAVSGRHVRVVCDGEKPFHKVGALFEVAVEQDDAAAGEVRMRPDAPIVEPHGASEGRSECCDIRRHAQRPVEFTNIAPLSRNIARPVAATLALRELIDTIGENRSFGRKKCAQQVAFARPPVLCFVQRTHRQNQNALDRVHVTRERRLREP